MNKEVKKRKKRFWALCLVFVLMIGNIMPITAIAQEYNYDDLTDMPDHYPDKINKVKPGDTITVSDCSTSKIVYHDSDDNLLKEINNDPAAVTGDNGVSYYQHKVMQYSDLPGNKKISDGDFKEWKVSSRYYSSKYVEIHFMAVPYTKSNIFYVLNDGVNDSSNPSTYKEGVGVESFAAATKTGYTFDGWYSDANFNTKVTSIPSTQTGAVTLYAKFTPKYGITYELNGGTNSADNPSEYTYGTGVESFASAIKESYTFDGWYSDADFNTEVTSISATQTGAVTLYAKFTPNTYGITYELNGGTNAAGNPTGYTYGTGVGNFVAATKTGYTFDGWYSDADFSTEVTSISSEQTGDVKLYAKFTPDTYGITYELNGGTNAAGNPSEYTYGTGVESFAAATKAGCTFGGWYSNETFTDKVESIATDKTGEVKLYAKFTPDTYGITYELNGGTNAAGNPTGYTYGTGVGSFAAATKTGYTFDGWYSDADFNTKITSIASTQTGAVKLYAKFTSKGKAANEDNGNGGNTTPNADNNGNGGNTTPSADNNGNGNEGTGQGQSLGDNSSKGSNIEQSTGNSGNVSDTDKSADNSKNDDVIKDKQPETGDSTPIAWMLVLLFASASGILFVLVRHKISSRREK